MSKLTAKSRRKIKRGYFVFPDGTKADPKTPKFPIHNKSHAANALSRAGQKRSKLEPKERCMIVQRVCRKFPRLGLCDTGHVKKGSQIAHCSGLTAR